MRQKEEENTVAISEIRHVALAVSNMERSVAFYRMSRVFGEMEFQL